MKRRLLAAVLVAGLVALAGGLLVRSRPDAPDPTDATGHDVASGAGLQEPSDPVLRPSPTRDASGAPDTPVATVTPRVEAAPDDTPAGAVLRVRVEAPLGVDPAAVKLRLEWDRTARSRGSCVRWFTAESGTAEIPVEELLGDEDVSQVRVSARHPDCLDVLEVVSRDEFERVGAEAVLTLRRAILVTGRAVDREGSAFPNVSVSLFETGPGAPIHDPQYHWATPHSNAAISRPDGHFRLKVADPGEYLLVAHRRRYVPVGRLVTLEEGAPTDVGDLALGRGVAISGSLSFLGRPASGVEITARRQAEGAWSLANGEVAWDGATLRAGASWARTDGEGRFRLEGLHAGRHLLLIGRWADRSQAMSHEMRNLGEATAPQDDLRLEMRAVLLRIRTVANGRPVPRVRVLLMPEGGGAVTTVDTDERGRGTALLAPDASFLAWVESSDHQGERIEVETGTAGTRDVLEVPVVPRPKAATLTLHLRNEARRPIQAATVRCTLEGGGLEVEMQHPRSPEGEFRIDLPAGGVWRVRVLPGVTSHWTPGDVPYQAVEATVDVAEGGQVERVLVAPVGGRILLDVRDTNGTHLPASVRVFDERGVLLEGLRWRVTGPRVTLTNASDLPGWGPATGNDVLAPGRYEIELDVEDHEVVDRTVDVRPKETTRVEVRLPAR